MLEKNERNHQSGVHCHTIITIFSMTDLGISFIQKITFVASVQHFNLTLPKHIPAVYGQLINTGINWLSVCGHNIQVSSNFNFNPLELLF